MKKFMVADPKTKDHALEHKQVKDVSTEPLPLPPMFEWCLVDLKDDE